MSERNLYRGLNDFQGSITDDGRLYDENHRLVGRIVGNDVYDNGNVKQGTIDENGKLWDCNHTFVGEEHGSNFIGPSYQSTGMVRGDSIGEGHGREYGALMMLKKRNEWYSGKRPDNNYEFGNGRKDDKEEEEDEGDFEPGIGDESVVGDEDSEDDAERYDYDLSRSRAPHGSSSHAHDCRSASKQNQAYSMPTRRRVCDSSYVPPDSFFSTGRKNEYRINGMIYVDVSGMSLFWTSVHSMLAGLSGKGIITGLDRMNGTWDRMKQEAYRNG